MSRWLLILFCLIPLGTMAQDTLVVKDTTQTLTDSVRPALPAGKAAYRSLFVPGWGQWLNRQYYKSPLFLGGTGLGIYAMAATIPPNNRYRLAAGYRVDGDSTTIDEFEGTLSTADLLKMRRNKRVNRNAAVISTLFVYGLNILDAYTVARIRNITDNTTHYPQKAAFYSMLLPGLGQLYNRKYWKIPVVYAALGVATYFIIDNTRYMNIYGDYYLLLEHEDESAIDAFETEHLSELGEANIPYFRADHSELLDNRALFKQWRDYSYIGFVALYALQIIDAVVDAHLYDFDISDDLSLNLEPMVSPGIGGLHGRYGLSFQWKF